MGGKNGVVEPRLWSAMGSCDASSQRTTGLWPGKALLEWDFSSTNKKHRLRGQRPFTDWGPVWQISMRAGVAGQRVSHLWHTCHCVTDSQAIGLATHYTPVLAPSGRQRPERICSLVTKLGSQCMKEDERKTSSGFYVGDPQQSCLNRHWSGENLELTSLCS